MIDSEEGNVILKEAGKFSGKGRGKLWSPVGDHFGVKAESRENMGEKELGNSGSVNVFSAGAINYPLHKAMVYHDHDRIKTMGIRQSHDKIHQYGREWEGGFHGQRGESGYRGVCVYFGHLAFGTP